MAYLLTQMIGTKQNSTLAWLSTITMIFRHSLKYDLFFIRLSKHSSWAHCIIILIRGNTKKNWFLLQLYFPCLNETTFHWNEDSWTFSLTLPCIMNVHHNTLINYNVIHRCKVNLSRVEMVKKENFEYFVGVCFRLQKKGKWLVSFQGMISHSDTWLFIKMWYNLIMVEVLLKTLSIPIN